MKVGDYRSPAEVTIGVGSSLALKYAVTGENEKEVRGLTAHLHEILEANQRAPTWYSQNGFAFALGLVWFFGGIGLFALVDKNPGEGTDVPLPFYVAWGAAAALIALLWLLTPNLELLGPGDPPRLRRLRTAAVGVIVALVVGVVSSVLAGLLTD